MRHVWTTVIIVMTWIASTMTLILANTDVFLTLLLTMAATIYFILFGLQTMKD